MEARCPGQSRRGDLFVTVKFGVLLHAGVSTLQPHDIRCANRVTDDEHSKLKQGLGARGVGSGAERSAGAKWC